MGDIVKQICRLCLEAVSPGNGEAIEEIKKEILEILLINIDLNISDNAVACDRCVEELEECFDFKSSCFYVDDYIAPFVNADLKVDIKKVFQKQMMTNETVDLENVQICRLCMSLIEDEGFDCATDLKEGVCFKDMIGSCLPEINLNTVHEPVICKQCLSNIEKYNQFMKICHEVEQRIHNYCKVVTSYGKIDLENVLDIKYCDTLRQSVTIIREECSDVKIIENDINTMKCHENEEPAIIECEEIDIKQKLDDSVPKRKKRIRKPGSKEEEPHRYFCPKCPYSTYKCGNLKIHMDTHKDNEVHKCFLCPFITNSKKLLARHMRTHKGLTKTFGCSECSLETNYKDVLLQHFVKHKDDSEVVIHQCKECSFSTKIKRNFTYHVLKHKKLKDIRMLKCEKCEFRARYRRALVAHMLSHETFKYECKTCSCQFKRYDSFKRHMKVHLEGKLYRCDQCMYCTNVRRNLLNHKQVHNIRVTLQCDKCDFQTKSKSSLRGHKLVHNPNRPTFKCNQCEFSTNIKIGLKQHLVSHMGLDEAVMYCCATCNFETKYKRCLLRHVRNCLKMKKNGNKKISCRPTTDHLQNLMFDCFVYLTNLEF